jgi:CBS domain-containing protein
MRVDRIYTRHVVATKPDATLAEAACAMARYQVGTLIVVDDERSTEHPVGIVTDRDLAVHGFASESNRVASVMTPVVATVRHDADAHEALELMRAHGARRLMVMDDDGQACGMLSIDDILDGLAADFAAAAAVLRGEIRKDAAGLGEVKTGA